MKNSCRLVTRDTCAWPNLFRLADQSIAAIIFNAPAHGTEEGSLELWVTTDAGERWDKRSIAVPAPAGQNRMHCCCGVRNDGTIDILSSGFSIADGRLINLERVWHSSSTDNGHNWWHNREISVTGVDLPCIAYGAIFEQKSSLFASVYRSHGRGNPSYSWLIKSSDNGQNWSVHSRIGEGDTNEAYVLPASTAMIAAVRTHIDHHLRQYSWSDTAEHWRDDGPLTLPLQHPGHLLSLGGGHLLLSYGIRNRGLMAIGARFSCNGGITWGAPVLLHQFPDETTDCGYPSSILIDENYILTGFYTNCSDDYRGYQFGTVRWKLSDYLAPQVLATISDRKKMQI